MWIISCPKYIITSSRVLWTVTVWRGVLWSKCFSHTDCSSSNLVRSDIFFECTKILQFYSVVSSLMPTHCFQQIFKGRSHQWECFGLKGDFEREKIVRRRTRAEERGPISLADEFTSLTCSAVSPEIKIGSDFCLTQITFIICVLFQVKRPSTFQMWQTLHTKFYGTRIVHEHHQENLDGSTI